MILSLELIICLFLFFLCWGSFLNVLGYRLVHNMSPFLGRSLCPHCTTIIAWYDNIPVFSWIILQGKCRSCSGPISFLYPFIELSTGIILLYLWIMSPNFYYFISYFTFFCGLLATTHSDLATMYISLYTTSYLIPIGFACSFLDWIPLSLFDSVVGTCTGYGLLFVISRFFFKLRGKKGLGEGDMHLLACIGSFTGVLGVWATLLISSVAGSIVGITGILIYGTTLNTRIPFAPFLAIGALSYVLWRDEIIFFLLGPL